MRRTRLGRARRPSLAQSLHVALLARPRAACVCALSPGLKIGLCPCYAFQHGAPR